MIAVYPGCFDPLTVGHLEIIQRAAKLFDEVYVCVLINVQKHTMFRADERVEMIEVCIESMPNVRAMSSDGMLLDVMKQVNGDVILRGLRSEADYLNEKSVTDAFLKLEGMETLFLQCDPEFGYISSSLVRELMRFHALVDMAKLVPAPILDKVTAERSK